MGLDEKKTCLRFGFVFWKIEPQTSLLSYTDYLEIWNFACTKVNVASLDMILSIKRITKALIRLRGCAGWSAPVLFANHRRQVFSRRGPYLRQFCFWTVQFDLPITCKIKCRMAKLSTLISLLLQEWSDLAIYCLILTLLWHIRRTNFTWFQNRQNVCKV